MAKKAAPKERSGKSTRGRKDPPRTAERSSWRTILAANAETIALIGVVVGGLLAVGLANGDAANPSLLRQVLGVGAWPAVIILLGASLALLSRPLAERLGWGHLLREQRLGEGAVGLGLMLLSVLGLVHLATAQGDALKWALQGQGGGLVGWAVGTLPATLLSSLVATLVLLILLGLGLWVAVRSVAVVSLDRDRAVADLTEFARRLLPTEEEMPAPAATERPPPARGGKPAQARGSNPPSEAAVADAEPSMAAAQPPAKPAQARRKAPAKLRPRPDYLPSLELLFGEGSGQVPEADLAYKTQVIEETLASFSVPVRVVDINIGPAVTQFGVEPGYTERRAPDGRLIRRRVRVSRIKSLADDLALALEAPTLRIEAPVPGKGYVGIEVPNSAAQQVPLRAVLESPEYAAVNAPLAFALGRDVSGEPVAANLAAMPHLLIAGATGSGKSVCIHGIVSSLLFSNGPDRLRLLLVDPKRVELSIYNGVPHLLAPVVTEVDQVVGGLTWLLMQMDERYRAFARVGARHLEDFNRKVGHKRRPAEWRDLAPYPYMVLVVDELADLMVAAPEAVEHHLCRLAQMARATGIHLVVATQRPSVDVVTGLIKANFPARIAFAVTSQTDSRVILDTPGADKLLGRGDMLFMRPDSSKLARVQGCFVSEKEVGRLVSFWKEAMPAEALAPDAPRYPWTGLMAQLEDQDDLYDRALDLVQKEGRVSTSWLQRRLRVGYHKAAELIARMEADGYIGPDEGAGRGREVLLAGEGDEEEDLWQ